MLNEIRNNIITKYKKTTQGLFFILCTLPHKAFFRTFVLRYITFERTD